MGLILRSFSKLRASPDFFPATRKFPTIPPSKRFNNLNIPNLGIKVPNMGIFKNAQEHHTQIGYLRTHNGYIGQ